MNPLSRCLVVLLLLLTVGAAHAEEPVLPAGVTTWEVQRDAQGKAGLMSVDLVDADIRSVLRLFAEVGGLNFVMSEGVKGRVTARLTDVRWEDALATILLAKGLAATPVAGTLPVLQIQPFTTH